MYKTDSHLKSIYLYLFCFSLQFVYYLRFIYIYIYHRRTATPLREINGNNGTARRAQANQNSSKHKRFYI